MISRSSCGPGLAFLRLEFFFFGTMYYYHSGSCLWHREKCPSRGSDPNDLIGHASASRVCLPVPALGHLKVSWMQERCRRPRMLPFLLGSSGRSARPCISPHGLSSVFPL